MLTVWFYQNNLLLFAFSVALCGVDTDMSALMCAGDSADVYYRLTLERLEIDVVDCKGRQYYALVIKIYLR